MSDSARALAEAASFQAFINCYLREFNSGRWHQRSQWLNHPRRQKLADRLRGNELLLLTVSGTQYCLDVRYRSRVGPHQFYSAFRLQQGEWENESLWSLLLHLVRDIYSHHQLVEEGVSKRRQLELTYRLTDSLQNMSRYLQYWQAEADNRQHFITAEQKLVFGHWLHPTPKSRQGCLDWQQPLFSPELRGRFQLQLFAVDRELFRQNCEAPADDPELTAEQIIQSLFTVDAGELHSNEALIPVHPLQAQWLEYQPHIRALMAAGKLRNLGTRGPEFLATSSMRTLYAENSPWMLKLSIPVKLTNSLRQNKAHELDAGVLAARLLKRLKVAEHFPQFHFIADPAWVTVNLTEAKADTGEALQTTTSGFECIIRENPFPDASAQVVCIASIAQDPVPPAQQSSLAEQLKNLSAQLNQPLSEIALRWFECYWRCAIEPCIQLYDHFGIALEAHQQNVLLELENGFPAHCFFRDNQGFYLSKHHRTALLETVPELANAEDLFYDDQMIINRFGYYLFVNQLFAIIHRMGADGLVGESTLLRLVVNKLRKLENQLGDNGRALVTRLLTSPQLASKANLLTRIKDIDELEVELELAEYTAIANPIAAITLAGQPQQVAEYA